MGTMERMRKTSPYLLALFAIIFVGFMVASDADISSILRQGSNMQTALIAEVNGEPILYKDFEEKVREAIEQQRQNQQDQTQDIDDLQIRRSIWNDMVEKILIKQEAEKIGIFVSNEEVLDLLFENPPDYLRKPFTDSAGFHKDQYLEIITKPDIIYDRLPREMSQEEKKDVVTQFRKDLIKLENFIREDKLREALSNVVNTSASLISPMYLKEKYLIDNSSADVNFIKLDLTMIPDNTIKVTNQEIEQYYEKTKKFHPQKPKRKIKYVIFQLNPSDKDSAVASKNVKNIYDAIQLATSKEAADSIFTQKMLNFKGETHDFTAIMDLPQNKSSYLTSMEERSVLGPVKQSDGVYFFRLDEKRTGKNEVVKASHILVRFGNNKDSARAEANAILKRAKSGEDFATMARELSEDKGSGMNGGDLGFFGKGRMVKEFEEAAFAAPVGSIVGPVETVHGFHIIKVTDKQSTELKYSEIKIAPEISRQTIKILGRNARDLKNKIESGVPFDSAAKEFNVVVRETDFFDRDKPALGSSYLADQAFTKDVGTVLDPLDLKNQGIVVAQISDSRSAGLVPLVDLKDKIKTTLTRIKKLDALKAKANEVYNKVKGMGNLTEDVTALVQPAQFKAASNVLNNGVVPGFGQDFAFTSKVFTLPLNTISEPVRGETGYYIIQVINRKIPDDNTVNSAMKEYTKTQRQAASSSAYWMWFQKIKEEADIKDNRSKFYREY